MHYVHPGLELIQQHFALDLCDREPLVQEPVDGHNEPQDCDKSKLEQPSALGAPKR